MSSLSQCRSKVNERDIKSSLNLSSMLDYVLYIQDEEQTHSLNQSTHSHKYTTYFMNF